MTQFKLLLMCSLFVGAYSLISFGPAAHHPNFPEQCYDALTHKGYAVGESWQRHGECTQYYCGEADNDASLHVRANWCAKVRARPPCAVRAANLTLRFPDCCPSLKCPHN